MWDWKKGCFGEEKHPIPEKKRKKVDNKADKGKKYVCLQCLEQHLKGKQDERFTSMCRADTSSITRHKKRWHYLPDAKPCTIVPESAPEVSALRKSYDKMKQKKNSTTLSHTGNFEIQPALQRPAEKMKKFSSDTDDAMETTNTTIHDALVDLQPTKLAHPEPHLLVKNQSTLFTSVGSKRAEETTDTSLKQVIDAVAELNLKVDSIAKQHRTLEQLALEDGKVRRSLSAMRKAENILQLTESSNELLEWFYDETTECAVLRCFPCFKLHVEAKPTLAKLTPLKAQRLLNTSGCGTLATGIFVRKEVTRLLIQGHNQTWYRQKNLCIEHVCLIGSGSITHKKAMGEFQKNKKAEKKATTTCGNIFRAAIVDIKLGAAGRNFETLISFLACCGVDVGSIGHSRNNFNHILYCLEKIIDNKVNTWLNTPLLSTLPPHFWATVDKATPS